MFKGVKKNPEERRKKKRRRIKHIERPTSELSFLECFSGVWVGGDESLLHYTLFFAPTIFMF